MTVLKSKTIKKIIFLVSIIFFFIFFSNFVAIANNFTLEWVEINLSITKDGKADFIYKIRWDAGASLHGLSVYPYFDMENSFAFDDYNNKYPLSIKEVNTGKYDIVLANNRAITNSKATYIIHFGGDLAQSGSIAITQSEFGELIVLNWAPPQWEYPMQHQTVYVHYPIEVQTEKLTMNDATQLGFRTEKFMNENYKLFYEGQLYNGTYYFTVAIHKENLEPFEKMQIQQYIPSSYFDTAKLQEKITYQKLYTGENPYLKYLNYLYFIIMSIFHSLYGNLKEIRTKKASEELPKIDWLSVNWVPPKIQVASFRQKGKIAQLDPPEALLLIGEPPNKIFTKILIDLKEKQAVYIRSYEPFKIL